LPKRPESVSTALVLLELLRRIPRGRKVTALELQEQLSSAGVVRDIRSIQRLLDDLCGRFDIEQDTRTKPYGYRWKEQAHGLSVPMLGAQESLLLMLAEQQLRNLLPADLMKSMDGFFEQARLNLSSAATTTREAEWLKKVRVVNTTQPLLPPKIPPAVMEAVSDALYRNRWLDVRYRNARDWVADYRVMPLGLAQQGTRLYLVCRFESFDDERNLALNRMESATATDFGFERPDFNLQRYVDEGRFGFGSGEKVRLSFWIERESGLHLTESRLSDDQECVEEGDGIRITATVVDTEVLDWWLRGFGERVREVERRPLANAVDYRGNQ